jgi:hypothetical protein
MFFGQLDGELITVGKQFPCYSYQKSADGFIAVLGDSYVLSG